MSAGADTSAGPECTGVPTWDTIEAEAHQAACAAYARDWAIVESSTQLQLALLCSDVARQETERTERDLIEAREALDVASSAWQALTSPEERRRARGAAYEAETLVLHRNAEAIRCLEWLRRATVTLENAIRLHSLGRT